jgi:uncharacterized protein YydD (DUF2326 family)
MKLSKLYSDNINFKRIIFNDGINFIVSDDHSVGKSTLFELIDFCLLKGDKGFLKREQFIDSIFFLELKINATKYITIKRPTAGRANIGIKILEHTDILIDTDNFDKTGGKIVIKDFFEDKLGLYLSDYRQYVSYFLRDQDNQSDVFRLNKFLRQRDINYKPIISSLLGIDGDKIKRKYELDNEIEIIEKEIIEKENNLGNYRTKESILEEISIYEKKLTEKEHNYQKFDFYLSEKNISKELVDSIETDISLRNQARNSLNREIDYINKSLDEEIAIDKNDIDGLFSEMELLFPENLKTNYDSVIEFNKQIIEERTEIFKENKQEFISKIENIEKELLSLNEYRKNTLSVLKSTDTMDKFKELEKEVINFKTKIEVHKERLTIFDCIKSKKDKLKIKKDELIVTIEENKKLIVSPFIIKLKENLVKYGKIIFDKELAFSIGFNRDDNIDFSLKVEDTLGFDNSLDEGNTIKKLLCFIFSASITELYRDKNFIKFIAFDSPFDGDKNTYQDGVYNAIKELESKNIQVIITTVSDVISNQSNINEIKEKYTVRYLSENDKLIGDF